MLGRKGVFFVEQLKVGVLALQGAFREHIQALEKCGIDAVEVRKPEQLTEVKGLIIPGGESTTIGLLMEKFQLTDKLLERAKEGMPIFGTCAGMIMLAKDIVNSQQFSLKLMDISVRRNAFGRQRESFEKSLDVPAIGDKPFNAVFIRAPYIEKIAPNVGVLCQLDDERIVFVRQGNFLACSFHPELTDDIRIHQYFIDIVRTTLE